MSEKAAPSKSKMSAQQEIDLMMKKAKHNTFEKETAFWLDTGNERLNAVLGSPKFGLAYGKMIELFGPNSHGKTLMATLLAALAQAKGAVIGWADLENSLDPIWAGEQGLKYEDVRIFRSRLVEGKKNAPPRILSAEELFDMMYDWILYKYTEDPDQRVVLVVDSLAVIQTGQELDTRLADQNLNTVMSVPKFMGKMSKRYMALAENCSTLVIFINQVRMKPMAFGNPEYTPGGEAMKFAAASRVGVRRVKGGKIVQGPKMIGLRGMLTNIKNKVGGGSREGLQVGFETRFGKRAWRFPTAEEVKKEHEGFDDDED